MRIRINRNDIGAFQVQMTSLQESLANAVDHLNSHYSELKAAARQRLGSLFDAGDYPATLEGLFECSWDFPSVEPPDYLRQLSPQLYAQEAARVAHSAASVAETTTAAVNRLGTSSAEISTVVRTITAIAEQTNLLALNATITADITGQIDAIQSDTLAAVDAIGQIAMIVRQINETQSMIAAAVEEQTTTTNEIGRSVSDLAAGSAEIAQTISGVATSARETTQGAGNTREAASELALISDQLRGLVGQFRY